MDRLKVPSGGGAPAIPLRIGHGYDIHRLKPKGRLILAGVCVSEEFGPEAHSDGDVVYHALVDALLGAMGWGDIGQHFSNTDFRWKNAESRTFVELVFAHVRRAGYGVLNLDTTIQAERPRLRDSIERMCRNTADLLQVPVDRVNIKAGTNEQCDAVGRGEAIAAHVVVLLSTGN